MMRFEVELKARIDEELKRLRGDLEAGMLKDYAQYQNYVGRIASLNNVTDEYIDEVNKKLREER